MDDLIPLFCIGNSSKAERYSTDYLRSKKPRGKCQEGVDSKWIKARSLRIY